MMRVAALLCLLLCIGACTSFEDLSRNVCGNGLVEAGEDCDSNEASCVRCAVVCNENVDCPTSAFSCGTDGTCHAPSGALGDQIPVGPFQGEEVMVTDIDHDGIGDVIGVSSTSIALRFGDPAGRLTRSQSVLTPSHSAPPAFADLDGDGATDIALSSIDGLVAYGSKFGNLAPIPVRSSLINGIAGDELDVRQLFAVGPYATGLIAVDPTNGTVAVAVFDVSVVDGSSFALPCAARIGLVSAAQLDLSSIDTYRVSDTDMIISMLVDQPTRKWCVLAAHHPSNLPWTMTDITPASAPAPTKKPIIADLDTDLDECPGLISSDGGPAMMKYWKGTSMANECKIVNSAMGTPLSIDTTADVAAVGRIALDPGFPFFARDMLVMTDGVYGYSSITPTPFPKLYTSLRPLGGAASADLDNDGQGDGVLIAADEDDVDVLFRRPNAAIGYIPGYVVYRVDTASKVTQTRIGDFDGNGKQDLALVEHLDGFDRLSVAYGRADFLQQPVTVATFSSVLSLTSLPLPNSEDQAGVTDDMLVLQPPPPGRMSPSLSVLFGTTAGTLIPFFDPRSDAAGLGNAASERDRTFMSNVFAGRFGLQPTQGEIRDLVAMGVPSGGRRTTPELWRMRGTEAGPDATTPGAQQTTGLGECSRGIGDGLCVVDAVYAPWAISDTTDAVLAVDHASPPHAVQFDPSTTGTVAATSLEALANSLIGKAFVRSIQRADLDGDGSDELIVVAAAHAREQGENAILVCQMIGATPGPCRDLVPEILDAAAVIGTIGTIATTCIDAAPARITARDRTTDATQARELVVACRDDAGSSLYRATVGASLGLTLLAHTTSKLTAIRAADVTGDGVDDVLALEGEAGVQSLMVFPQCGSREAASCRGGQ